MSKPRAGKHRSDERSHNSKNENSKGGRLAAKHSKQRRLTSSDRDERSMLRMELNGVDSEHGGLGTMT